MLARIELGAAVTDITVVSLHVVALRLEPIGHLFGIANRERVDDTVAGQRIQSPRQRIQSPGQPSEPLGLPRQLKSLELERRSVEVSAVASKRRFCGS